MEALESAAKTLESAAETLESAAETCESAAVTCESAAETCGSAAKLTMCTMMGAMTQAEVVKKRRLIIFFRYGHLDTKIMTCMGPFFLHP